MLLAMLPAMLPAPRRLSSAFDFEASAPSPSAASPDSLVIAADAAHGATQRVDHDADRGVAHGAARGDGTVRPGGPPAVVAPRGACARSVGSSRG